MILKRTVLRLVKFAEKKTVYAETTEEFKRTIANMKRNKTYKKYENFKEHVEKHILPRYRERSLKERLENKLPTHNQNTTNCVEYSFCTPILTNKSLQFDRSFGDMS